MAELLSSPKRFGVLASIASVASTALVVVACGSSDDSLFSDGADKGAPSGFVDDEFGSPDAEGPDADLYANDPPPAWCGPGGDPAPPELGGTLECPDDKNKPGCACATPGEKKACWTGLRKHRGLGVCRDGETTCVKRNEVSNVWGPCVGEVLPTTGATKGAEACGCFTKGQWKIANLSPCVMSFTDKDGTQVNAVSTVLEGDQVKCPEPNPPTGAPSQPWSPNTLTVDCAGHFKLCLRVRAGSFESPGPNDCILGEVCTEGDYKTANVEQAWPDLPGWLGADKACAQKWKNTPESQSAGYAEMIVKGTSVRCDEIDDGSGGDLVFNRTKYCPRSCSSNPTSAECASCKKSGQGQF